MIILALYNISITEKRIQSGQVYIVLTYTIPDNAIWINLDVTRSYRVKTLKLFYIIPIDVPNISIIKILYEAEHSSLQ